MKSEKNMDYWFFDSEGIAYFGTLNEARADLFGKIKSGVKSGGVIFGPRGSGVMIPFECGALWTGRRAELRPVREDGTLYPQGMVKEIRGF